LNQTAEKIANMITWFAPEPTNIQAFPCFSRATRYAARYGALRGLKSVSSTVTVNGRKLTRIAAMVLGDVARASATCRQIKWQGGACFVVPITGSQPVRMAQGGRLKIAVR
jgi:hypothetical protein